LLPAASVVVVVGDERLYSEIHSELGTSKPSVVVVKLPKSGGVRERCRGG